jgi:hypothetical protein
MYKFTTLAGEQQLLVVGVFFTVPLCLGALVAKPHFNKLSVGSTQSRGEY